MTRRRKTADIAWIIDTANRMIEATPPGWSAHRRGIEALLSQIILGSNNYYGFRWTKGDEDDTRRFYYGGTKTLADIQEDLRQDGFKTWRIE